jgi:hypothetical protein
MTFEETTITGWHAHQAPILVVMQAVSSPASMKTAPPAFMGLVRCRSIPVNRSPGSTARIRSLPDALITLTDRQGEQAL